MLWIKDLLPPPQFIKRMVPQGIDQRSARYAKSLRGPVHVKRLDGPCDRIGQCAGWHQVASFFMSCCIRQMDIAIIPAQ